MARKVFYSFHYVPDNWRAAQVRNIGVIEGNQPAKDHDWESVARGGDAGIERWIADQMMGRSCTVVLVGTGTAGRKWINHEIVRSWNEGLGVVGIRIHGLLNRDQQVSAIGRNPFDHITCGFNGKKLSAIAKCYDPQGLTSKERYAWIQTHLSNAVEEAIALRNKN